jgi:hypothetical protein
LADGALACRAGAKDKASAVATKTENLLIGMTLKSLKTMDLSPPVMLIEVEYIPKRKI